MRSTTIAHSGPRILRQCVSGGFGKGVFMLAVADGQHALARTLAHYEFESVRAGIDGDERGGAVIILSRSDGALPLAKIEGCDSVVGQHGKVAEFLARIVLGQARD